jgi:hypothetical protein
LLRVITIENKKKIKKRGRWREGGRERRESVDWTQHQVASIWGLSLKKEKKQKQKSKKGKKKSTCM